MLRLSLFAIAITLPVAAAAQIGGDGGPIVKIIPAGGNFATQDVSVTVDYCSTRPFATRTLSLTLNGQDVRSTFNTYTTGIMHNGEWCIYGMRSAGTLWLQGNVDDDYQFSAMIEDIDGYLGGDGKWFFYRPPGWIPPTAQVSVEQTEYVVHDKASASRQITFRVTNEGSRPRTYQIAATCMDAVVSCPPSTTSLALDTVAAGRSALVTVTYTTASTPNDTGTVRLRASVVVPLFPTGSATVADSAVTEVVVAAADPAPGSPGVVLAGFASTNGTVERDLCLTTKAGSTGAYECADLRLAHALPAVTTYMKPRSPTLIYNARHARPLTLVAGDVTIRSTEALPSQVDVTVTVGSRVVTRAWPGSEWGAPGKTRRIVVPVDSLPAGSHSLSIVARRVLSGVSDTLGSASGRVVVVDRSASPFGAGWWLAGLERLTFLSGTEVLWVGGDGSSRLYVKRGAGPVYDAPALDRPDSLSWDGFTGTRFLPDGGTVLFDINGRHAATRDRFGRETQIVVASGSDRVDSLRVPKPGGWLTYAFTYTAGLLSGVSAPSTTLGGATRNVTVTQSAGRITSIRDPDSTLVGFGYGSGLEANVVRSRTDRRNFTTHYAFDAGGNLVKDSLQLADFSVIVHGWLPTESRGLPGTAAAAAQPLDSVYTLVDGARTHLADHTRFWLTRYGAPWKIRNAHGEETKVTYHGSWPALASEVRSPSGLNTTASYNTRGLADWTAVVNLRSVGDTALTRYEWHASRPLPARIVRPTGDSTLYDYDSNGNVLWVQIGPDPARRTVAEYYGSGDPAAGLYRSSSVPGRGERDTVTYDALANVSLVVDRTGARAFLDRDAIGRVTRTRSPLDTSAIADTTISAWRADSTHYDLAGQVIRQVSFGPERSYTSNAFPHLGTQPVPADTLIVITRYDTEGNVTQVERRATPDRAAVGVAITEYTYDGAGRRTGEHSGATGEMHTWFDPAGNLIEKAEGATRMTMKYDALSRIRRRVTDPVLYTRTTCSFFEPEGVVQPCNFSFALSTSGNLKIPGDTAVFEYDMGGNAVRADNRFARIRRVFSPGGLLLGDTTRIRTLRFEKEGSRAPWRDFTSHIYALGMTYDKGGRRVTLAHPDVLDPCMSACPAQQYAYDPVTGVLASIVDVRGKLFQFRSNVAGQLDTLIYPGNVREVVRQYDPEGRIVRREVIDAVGALLADTMRYDPQGRIVTGRGLVPGRGGNQMVENVYSGLGTLAMLEHTITTSNPRLEEYKTDALGNRYWSRRHGVALGSEDNPSVRNSAYDAYGRLLRVTDPVIPSEPFEDIARHDYDEAGRLKARAAHTTRYSSGSGVTSWVQEMHYYNGDGRLALLERHNDQIEASPGEDNDLIEWYRYDAFGRRVLVHTLRGRLACRRAGCESTVRRFVWDGDDLFYETRGPAGDSTTSHPVASSVVEDDRPGGDGEWGAPKAYGTLAYTHAGGIDRPIGLIRLDGSGVLAAFGPHTNWRGLYELGTDEAGAMVTRSIGWPGKDATAFIGQNQPKLPYEWFGSLIAEQADASGLLYRRNRYYDPQTGRFTQPDPIGLAGGLNVYGFANGDPVNFSDPFGLCPNPPCFKVLGGDAFSNSWNRLVAASPYLADLVRQASRDDGPQFNLRQFDFSLQEATGGEAAFGATYFYNAEGKRIEPGTGQEIARIEAYVSTTDLGNAALVSAGKAEGRNPTLSNVQVHEFGHGILGIQGYRSTERQAFLVECKAIGEAGGSCHP
ncbi:MAG: RHS repeat-associated core domain-containing protein [Gemmatimonadaceae bacterium]